MKLDRQTHETRIHETARAIADLGPMEARHVMRTKYKWSQRTWQNYFDRALVALRANRMCLDAERDALIACVEGIMRDPKCGPGTAKGCADILAKLKGAYAPTLIDARTLSLTADLPSAVQRLLASQDALARAQTEDARYLALQAPPRADRPAEPVEGPLAAQAPQTRSQEP